jgi:hypothetical protein
MTTEKRFVNAADITPTESIIARLLLNWNHCFFLKTAANMSVYTVLHCRKYQSLKISFSRMYVQTEYLERILIPH